MSRAYLAECGHSSHIQSYGKMPALASLDDEGMTTVTSTLYALQERQKYTNLEAKISRHFKPQPQRSPDARLEMRALQQRACELSEECAVQKMRVEKLEVHSRVTQHLVCNLLQMLACM